MGKLKHTVSFGRMEYIMGDHQIPIKIDGEVAGYMNRVTGEGLTNWYTNPCDHPAIGDMDHGDTVSEAKASVREMVTEYYDQFFALEMK